jgi:hypothetical protein
MELVWVSWARHRIEESTSSPCPSVLRFGDGDLSSLSSPIFCLLGAGVLLEPAVRLAIEAFTFHGSFLGILAV